MNINFKLLIFGCFICTFLSCESPVLMNRNCINSNNYQSIKIMPLGDSRVEGDRPNYESYRYELWRKLTTNLWNIDFVGRKVENAYYPDVDGICFDLNHEGTIGALSQDILSIVINLPQELKPDVVLVGLGINDLTNPDVSVEMAIANITAIIQNFMTLNHHTKIFVEQIPPPHSSIRTAYFDMIYQQFNDSIVTLSEAFDHVHTIDLSTNWSDDFLIDDLHYNEIGAKFVAEQYYQELILYL